MDKSTKQDEVNYVQEGYWLGQFEKVRRERDELRAEIRELNDKHIAYIASKVPAAFELDELRAEIERLKETIAEWQTIHGTFAASGAPDDIHHACQAEVERLRTLVEMLQINERNLTQLLSEQAHSELRADSERLLVVVKLVASMPITATAKDFDALVGAAREALGRHKCPL